MVERTGGQLAAQERRHLVLIELLVTVVAVGFLVVAVINAVLAQADGHEIIS
jgi:hypothetical protein